MLSDVRLISLDLGYLACCVAFWRCCLWCICPFAVVVCCFLFAFVIGFGLAYCLTRMVFWDCFMWVFMLVLVYLRVVVLVVCCLGGFG